MGQTLGVNINQSSSQQERNTDCSVYILCLINIAACGILAYADDAEVEILRKANLDNISILQRITFSENSTLLDDMRMLDRAYEQLTKTGENEFSSDGINNSMNNKTAGPKKLPSPPRSTPNSDAGDQRSKFLNSEMHKASEKSKVAGENPLEIRLIVVGDYSLYEKFLQVYHNDDFVAYNAIHQYLNGIYDQIRIIFSRFVFFGRQRIGISLADVLTIFRVEDCPFRGPYLKAQYIERRIRNQQLRENAATVSGIFDGDLPNSTSHYMTTNYSSIETTDDIIFDGNRSDEYSDVRDYVEDSSYIDLSRVSWTRIYGLTAIRMINLWLRRNEYQLPPHEHVLVISNYDLITPRNDSATQGMAYVRAICRDADSASVVEDVGGLATATISAHEIIHSLGSFHDDPVLGCANASNFLMAPSLASADYSDNFNNSFQLSECSVRDVETFLNSSESNCLRTNLRPKQQQFNDLAEYADDGAVQYFKQDQQMGLDYDDDNDSMTLTAQLYRRNSFDWEDGNRPRPEFIKPGRRTGEAKNGAKIDERRRQLPGQLFDINQQCRIAFGWHYGLCRKREFVRKKEKQHIYNMPWRDPCNRLWCMNRRLRRYVACETKAFLPLMDGTACGKDKWCISGVCVQKVPAFNSECENVNDSYCNTLSDGQRKKFCATKSFAAICCKACKITSIFSPVSSGHDD